MGPISPPSPVKLMVGMLSADQSLMEEAAARLAELYGPIDIVSPTMPFNWTNYYRDEMGERLLRRFVAFERLIQPDEIAAIKLATNLLEEQFAAALAAAGSGPPRPINLDPGYVSPSKLVLASTKDFAHRIYLADGIYAEVTLAYVRGRWQSHACTFPDYGSGTYDDFLTAVREALRAAQGRSETAR